jgi:beta-glucosidase/6-phospho-beta-glucosidase/beta-galactosidase
MRCLPTGLRSRERHRLRARHRDAEISRRLSSPPARSMHPYLTAIMEGRYRESFLAAAGADAPKVAAGDMNAIASVPYPAKYPTMNSSWLKIGPEALYWGPRNVAKVWNASDIYITENGCSATDVPAAEGLVHDTDRIMFLRSYLSRGAAISIGA